MGGWLGTKVGVVGWGNLASTRIRSPDRPARGESLYRLRYPGPINILEKTCQFWVISNPQQFLNEVMQGNSIWLFDFIV